MNFALLQCASSAPTRRAHLPKPMCSPNLLSWAFVRPSADIPDMQVSPTPSRRTTLRMLGTNRTSCSASVVSLHHDGLLRMPAPGLLHPGTDRGVHCVSAFPEPETGTTSPRKRESLGPQPLAPSGGFPATRFIPLDEFPSSAAAPHHCGRCPLVVTTCSTPCSRALRRVRFARPATTTSRDRRSRTAPTEAGVAW
jgi:hypothetical protein